MSPRRATRSDAAAGATPRAPDDDRGSPGSAARTMAGARAGGDRGPSPWPWARRRRGGAAQTSAPAAGADRARPVADAPFDRLGSR